MGRKHSGKASYTIRISPAVYAAVEKYTNSDLLGRPPHGAVSEFIETAILNELQRIGQAVEVPEFVADIPD